MTVKKNGQGNMWTKNRKLHTYWAKGSQGKNRDNMHEIWKERIKIENVRCCRIAGLKEINVRIEIKRGKKRKNHIQKIEELPSGSKRNQRERTVQYQYEHT